MVVYDIHNKFIAFHSLQPFPPILDIVCEWGVIYIIAGTVKEERKVRERARSRDRESVRS